MKKGEKKKNIIKKSEGEKGKEKKITQSVKKKKKEKKKKERRRWKSKELKNFGVQKSQPLCAYQVKWFLHSLL